MVDHVRQKVVNIDVTVYTLLILPNMAWLRKHAMKIIKCTLNTPGRFSTMKVSPVEYEKTVRDVPNRQGNLHERRSMKCVKILTEQSNGKQLKAMEI